MINKYEATGIFVSIAVMIIALLVMHGRPGAEAVTTPTDTNASVAVATSSATSQQDALYSALTKALANDGTVKKLVVDDVKVGTGTVAQAGDTVTVNYIGTLTNGTEFDSSYKRNQPFTFTLGAGQVIKGWDKGVAGMKVGGKRILVIPPSLGYGSRAAGPIPANSTLVFAVELLKVQPPKK